MVSCYDGVGGGMGCIFDDGAMRRWSGYIFVGDCFACDGYGFDSILSLPVVYTSAELYINAAIAWVDGAVG